MSLFAASQRPLHAYILAMVFDPDAAADILQETNIVLWQKFDQFEIGTSFLAWARGIARIGVLRHRQKTSTRIAAMDPMQLESLATCLADRVGEGSSQRREALDVCLKKLSPADRELVLARYAPGASVASIADRLERTANSVSQSLCRIRRALLKCAERRLQSAGYR